MNPLAVFQAAELQAVTYSEAQPARVVNEHMIGTFQGRDADAEISVTRPEAAAQMLEQKSGEGLYQEKKSPYPGFLSKTVKCPKEFLPEIDCGREKSESAPARMHARACDAGELSLFTFCSIAQREVLLQIESYLPKSETLRAAEYLRQVSC